ncbi:hypothetical protein [Aquimarina sp. 2201CG14-23]|uniref:hypothetical protein n=1 Tax=Aquimarina mycalae TaxID=3040073 RepID=UPI002477FB06|nr:hypothetical protein [Aquimarina sp. 2201CG14-23]MDH7445840.1 hypothetical protein [Aquimarina sp. 2201CG14-23]
MKQLILVAIVLFSMVCNAQVDPDSELVVETVFLAAEAPNSNLYTLISTALSEGGDPIDAPDKTDECTSHSASGKHIEQVFDEVLDHHVFSFLIHATADNLGCSHNSDIQRTEIKTYDQAPDNLLGTLEETIEYRWNFKLPEDFQPSESFAHVHQLISVLESNEEKPLITLTATKQDTLDVIEVQYTDELDNQIVLTSADLAFFKGNWVSVTEKIEYGESARYQIVIRNLLSGSVILSHSSNIKTWMDGTEFVGAKWGINRDTNVMESLKDEQVLFDAFIIYDKHEEDEDEDEQDPFDDVPDPDAVNFCAGEIEYKTIDHFRFSLYKNPYEYADANLDGIPEWDVKNNNCGASNDNYRGKYIEYKDIYTWNRNNPCKQIKIPAGETRLASEERDGKYGNPYGKRHVWVFPVGWRDRTCFETREFIEQWNEDHPKLYIELPPPPPQPEIPNDPIPDDDDITVGLPEEPTIEGYIPETGTVFSLTEQTETLTDLGFLVGETADIILPNVEERDYNVREFENNERDEHGHKKRSDNKKKWYDIAGIADMGKSLVKAGIDAMKTPGLGYYDPAGMFIRAAEKDQIQEYRNKSFESAKKFATVGATTVMENLDRNAFDMDAGTLPFFVYRNACGSYLSPFKKKKCEETVSYLQDALNTVNQVIFSYDRSSPYNRGGYFKPNRGISEQIREKYVAIQNKIFRELEELKSKSEKEGLLSVFRH